eukprot:Selendium_serpulae@DN6366_c1_g3_i5.p1
MQTLQGQINVVTKWCEDNLMVINMEKTLHLKVKARNVQTEYKLGTFPITTVKEVRDLGVTYDNQLKFSQHVSVIVQKANIALRRFQHSIQSRATSVVLRYFDTYIRPIVEFASPVWNALNVRDQERIEGVLKRTTRLAEELRDLQYVDRLWRLQMLSLKDRREQTDLVHLFNIQSGKCVPPRHPILLSSKPCCTKSSLKALLCGRGPDLRVKHVPLL